MSDKAFHMLNNVVLEFVVKHRDVDPVVATMQRTITELSRQTADLTLDFSKRILTIGMAANVLRVLLDYISEEYPEEYKALPPVSGFTRR